MSSSSKLTSQFEKLCPIQVHILKPVTELNLADTQENPQIIPIALVPSLDISQIKQDQTSFLNQSVHESKAEHTDLAHQAHKKEQNCSQSHKNMSILCGEIHFPQHQKTQKKNSKLRFREVQTSQKEKESKRMNDYEHQTSQILHKLKIDETLLEYLRLFKQSDLQFRNLVQMKGKQQNQRKKTLKQSSLTLFIKFSAREILIYGNNKELGAIYFKKLEEYCKTVNLMQVQMSNITSFKMLLMNKVQMYLAKNQIHVFKSKQKGGYLIAGKKSQNQLYKIWKELSSYEYRYLSLSRFLNKQPYLTIISQIVKTQKFVNFIQKYSIFDIQVVSYDKQKCIRESQDKKQNFVNVNIFCLVKVKPTYNSFSQIKIGLEIYKFIKNHYNYLVYQIYDDFPKYIEKSQLKKIKVILKSQYLTIIWQSNASNDQKVKMMKYLQAVKFIKLIYVDHEIKANAQKEGFIISQNKNTQQEIIVCLEKLMNIQQVK